jgi:hypothetical protein
MVLHRRLVMGEPIDARFVARVVDEIVVPAAHCSRSVSQTLHATTKREL